MIQEYIDSFIKDLSKIYDLRFGKPFDKEKANCAWFTKVFFDWCKSKNIPVKAIYFDHDTEAHIAPLIDNKIIDFTIKQFTKNQNDNYQITKPEDYQKWGYQKYEVLESLPDWLTIKEADKKSIIKNYSEYKKTHL